ncbi:hypothetical protein N0V93_009333 [Gnomoniopsis smithogilvyi]|uniref:AAA+ ATPase domain-containing protein n=1 Tax=Gnomoniopsis smithogilvyi TaxID=1191159 RepID=A0A9W8YMY6_9PEZI|nr:hypothetical protein N0V93_009333 [Gnomoniopsis smithogilvyi]
MADPDPESHLQQALPPHEANETDQDVPGTVIPGTGDPLSNMPSDHISDLVAGVPVGGHQESDVLENTSREHQDRQLFRQTLSEMNEGIREIVTTLKTFHNRTRSPSPPVASPTRSRASSSSTINDKVRYLRTSLDVIAKVRDCNWRQFMNQYPQDGPKCAMDVLVYEPDLAAAIKRESARRKLKLEQESGHANGTPIALKSPANADSETLEKVPEPQGRIHRVRIHSVAINLLLRLVVQKDLDRWDQDTKTFQRPFRCFISFQSRMREEFHKLKTYVHAQNPMSQESASATIKDLTGSAPQDSSSKPHTRLSRRMRTEDLDMAYIARLPGAVDQIQCYLDFVENRIIPVFNGFNELHPNTSHSVRYEDLWYLFRAGDLLYAPEKNAAHSQKQEIATAQTIWKIYDIILPGDKIDDENDEDLVSDRFSVQCYYVDYDGVEFCPISKTFHLPEFDGERKVTSLPLYPLRFAANSAQILKNAQSTGQNFVNNIMNPSRYGSYSGWTVIHNPLGEPVLDAQLPHGENTKAEHINSEVIVDTHWKPRTIIDIARSDKVSMRFDRQNHEFLVWKSEDLTERSFYSEEVICDGMRYYDRANYFKQDKYLCPKEGDDDRRPTPKGEDLALLPRRIVGYALWERKFVQLDVSLLHPVTINDKDNPFDKLQIPTIQKNLIQSIISSHFVRNDLENSGIALGSQDIIRGKGKGVLILLHGVPGVGKTATAEAVAQKWGKPLFPITCGDLGFTAESVESSLNAIFRLAHLWDCVLLLDEADVFITQRTKSDLQRNALVSVFLRMMEYYNGILFLTTNRPGVIDEAVKSRVHVSLRYEALSLEQTVAIFEQNINQLRSIEQKRAAALNVPVMDIFDDQILEFAHHHWHNHDDDIGRWNGRQIRNAFSTAAALAHFEVQGKAGRAVQLRAEHFRQVQDASLVYEQYRASILNKTDGEIAKQHEARNDMFDERTFSLSGPQTHAQRGSEPFKKYVQPGMGTPSTPNRGQQHFRHNVQPQVSPVPFTFNQQSPKPPAPTAGGYAQHAGGYGSAQSAQTGGYHPAQQANYAPPDPELYGQSQQGGYPPRQSVEHLMPRAEPQASPSPNGIYPAQSVNTHVGLPYDHQVDAAKTRSSMYYGDGLRDQTPS